MPIHQKILYVLLIVEGAIVMAIELIGAKLIMPFFGASTIVWVASIVATMGGLALGYFMGGSMAEKNPGKKLIIAMVVASVFLLFLPIITTLVLPLMLKLPVVFGIFCSSVIIAVVPLMCLGMAGPLAVELLKNSNSVGKVYAFSTFGGIVSTFLFGLFLIPNLGLRACCFLCGCLLFVVSVIYWYSGKSDFSNTPEK